MRRREAGFTLMELSMAMAITLVIGLAVAGVGVSLSNLHASSQAYYENLQNGRVGAAQLQAYLRGARLITAGSDDELILWASDVRDPGQINVSEVVKVYRDTTSKRLMSRSTIFPSSLPPDTAAALDVVIPLSSLTDPGGADEATGPVQYDVPRAMATGVEDLETYWDAAPPLSRMLKFQLTVGSGRQQVKVYGGGKLRADKVAKVGQTGGVYVLTGS